MKFLELAELYEKLESTSKKLEKRDILADFYKKCSLEQLPEVVLLSMGVIFPAGEEDLGIAKKMMIKVVSRSSGTSEKEVVKKYKDTGDLGLSVEELIKKGRQRTLVKKELTISHVFENLRKLPELSGSGSQDKKMALVAELLAHASGKEARYLVRIVLGDMRIGVAAGIVRDAIAKAFEKDKKDVEKAYDFTGDYGQVALMAKKNNLHSVRIKIGFPVRVMLAERAPDLKTAISEFDRPALEWKYDGFRISLHKDEEKIKIFSRRLEEVTKQFPDIVKWSRNQLKPEKCIVEGEVIAIDSSGRPLPFQHLSRRIQRKYDIEKTVKQIPVSVKLFDCIYVNGTNFMERPLGKRWDELKKIISPSSNFGLAEHIETKDHDRAEKFYKEALAVGQEGLIVKNLDAHYQPGKRVGFWLKVKQTMEPLDLVIVGAEWGEGKRAGTLGSLLLACRHRGRFLTTGMMGSGLTDEQLKEVTKRLKKIITEEKGKEVRVRPEVVIEIGYEEIQKSPKYETGYALRFPRLIRFREEEKKPEDADTLATIEKLFRQQKK
ncbi:MAG: ATP-dependent DNA ligase [Candidatus Aenigmarchaeota archaeon]|nr:ATP-dependent DNA ligase [Candidatus Aenigmarchaeota archaeon]